MTKLPVPNSSAGRFIVVFGLTLFIWTLFTTRFLNADQDELKPDACAVATPRTTSAVTSPPTRLTPAVSATPISVAVFVVESTVLVLEALRTFAFRMPPLGGGTAALKTWLLLLVEPMPDCELHAPPGQVAGVAAGSVWLIPKSVSWILAASALPLAFAPAGLMTEKLTGLTLVRSFSSALNDVEARVFMDTKRILLQGISPIVSLTLSASSPNRLVPAAVNPAMLGTVFTAASHRIPALPTEIGTNVVPFHVKALALIILPPNCVSNETKKSPGVRRGSCGQPELAGLVAASSWLNS